jgi:hypothetical protein
MNHLFYPELISNANRRSFLVVVSRNSFLLRVSVPLRTEPSKHHAQLHPHTHPPSPPTQGDTDQISGTRYRIPHLFGLFFCIQHDCHLGTIRSWGKEYRSILPLLLPLVTLEPLDQGVRSKLVDRKQVRYGSKSVRSPYSGRLRWAGEWINRGVPGRSGMFSY